MARIWNRIKGALQSRWGKVISIGGLVLVILGILANLTGLISFVIEYIFPDPKPTPTPTPLPTQTPVVVSIQSIDISSPVAVGEYATVKLKTVRGVTCHKDYYTPRGKISTSQDLNPILSDVDGMCTWKWRIASNTKPGKGRLVVSVEGIEEEHEIEITP